MSMSCWKLHQRVLLGNEEKIWQLSEGRGLTVGRSEVCNIVLQSQTVEDKHAIFEWDPKSICFIIRDLSSVNGTYVNNRPLRGNHALLKHNDAIRFGYDKDHVFRLEESFAPKTTKTSLSLSPGHVTSCSSPTITTNPLTTTQSTDVQLTIQNLHHLQQQQHIMPQTGGIQYVAMPSGGAQQGGGGFIPVMTQDGHLAYSYPQPISPMIATIPFHQIPPPLQIITPPTSSTHQSSDSTTIQKSSPIPHIDGSDSSHRSDGRRSVHLEQSPALNKTSKLYGQPSWWGGGEEEGNEMGGAEAASNEFKFQKPGSQILRELDPKSPSKLSIKDELRMSAITNQRQHHHQQQQQQQQQDSSWVVDCRQPSPPPPRLLRKSRGDHDMRPRSADPSPNRLSIRREPSPSPKKAVIPVAMKRSSSISSPRRATGGHQAVVPNAPKDQGAGRRQRAATPPVTRHTAVSVLKKPLDKVEGNNSKKRSDSRSSTPKAEGLQLEGRHSRSRSLYQPHHSESHSHAFLKSHSRKTDSISNSRSSNNRKTSASSSSVPNQPHSGSNSVHTQPHSGANSVPIQPHSGSNPVPIQPHSSKKESDHVMRDEAYLASSDESNSSLSDPTISSVSERVPVVVAHPDSRSAANHNPSNENSHENEEVEEKRRKQWTNSDEVQSPDSLMMASIEARMRRLSKLAHQTARQVTTLKTSVEEGHQMVARETNYLAMRSSSPVMTKAEQSLPEWKFFNKESNSIFRNIRVVEKWLQDIHANLNCIQPVDGEESIDFASDSELFLDEAVDSGSEEN